jgi:hypothetical protein
LWNSLALNSSQPPGGSARQYRGNRPVPDRQIDIILHRCHGVKVLFRCHAP